MARKPTLREQLEALIENFTEEIRLAFLASISDIVDNIVLGDMIAAIQAGNVVAAFRAVGYSEAAMRPITSAVERAFETGGVTVGKTFPKVLNTATGRTVYRFDVRNSRAERILRDNSSQLVTRVSEDIRVNIQNTMFEGVKAGNNPRKIALDIVGRTNPTTGKREGGIIGLTQGQERWVVNTRRDLEELNEQYFNRNLRDKRFDKVVRKAIDEGKPLPKDTVDKLVGRYKDKALKYRGDVVGRTEALQALNASEFEAYNQAVDTGAVASNKVLKYWESAGNDGRTRKSHLAMDKMKPVAISEPFTTPNGAKLMHPLDRSLGAPAEEIIQCRCHVRYKVSWLKDSY